MVIEVLREIATMLFSPFSQFGPRDKVWTYCKAGSAGKSLRHGKLKRSPSSSVMAKVRK